jgi:hypothetical protein
MLDVALQQIADLETENERLRVRLSSAPGPTRLPASVTDLGIRPDKPDSPSEGLPYADGRSSPAERIALFRALFVGRTDVYARRWVSKNGRVGWSPAEENPWEKNKLEHERVFFPLTDDVIGRHLRRPVSERDELHAGLYPLLPDDTTQLLVCDFDGKSGSKVWRGDADAYLRACADVGTPALLEISRSGEGAHVWVFFTEPVEAVAARTLGMGLIRQAIGARDDMSLSSYDRLIPSQDFVPTHSKKGARFGNLIALPLSGAAHASGTTLFCDPATWTPYRDQFAHLSGTRRLSPQRLHHPRTRQRRRLHPSDLRRTRRRSAPQPAARCRHHRRLPARPQHPGPDQPDRAHQPALRRAHPTGHRTTAPARRTPRRRTRPGPSATVGRHERSARRRRDRQGRRRRIRRARPGHALPGQPHLVQRTSDPASRPHHARQSR